MTRRLTCPHCNSPVDEWIEYDNGNDRVVRLSQCSKCETVFTSTDLADDPREKRDAKPEEQTCPYEKFDDVYGWLD